MKEESKEEKCDNCMIGYCSYCEKGQTKMYCDCTHTPQEEKKDWEEEFEKKFIPNITIGGALLKDWGRGLNEQCTANYSSLKIFINEIILETRADLIKELREEIEGMRNTKDYDSVSAISFASGYNQALFDVKLKFFRG